MQPTEASGKHVSIIKLLAAIVAGTFVFLFNQHTEKENTKYRETMKALEESKRSIEAIQQKLLEIQSRK